MRLSSLIVREASQNEFVIGMLLTSNWVQPVEASFENSSLRTVALELPTVSDRESDADVRIRIRCFLPD
jgi:hypothetical protein